MRQLLGSYSSVYLTHLDSTPASLDFIFITDTRELTIKPVEASAEVVEVLLWMLLASRIVYRLLSLEG